MSRLRSPDLVEDVRAAPFDYTEAFSRNIGLVSAAEQERLRRARVAIAGLGGVGGVYVQVLARLGIGGFTLADADRFELANTNRQAGATVETLGRAKVEVMAGIARQINPLVELRVLEDGVHEGNVGWFLAGADVVIDAVDFFEMGTRRLIFREARARGLPALTSAPAGLGATLHVFSPTGMSFDEYFDLHDGLPPAEQLLRFVLGLAPRALHRPYFPAGAVDVAARRVPSLSPGCFLCAGLVATEVVCLVLQRRPSRVAPAYLQFDAYTGRLAKGRLRWGNRGPVQRLKRWWIARRLAVRRERVEPTVR